eukprot:m.219722 g.219722  ORF g.219722 m.219722 type:complete len:90 (-) comp15585_c0_seq5:891-1160(-)
MACQTFAAPIPAHPTPTKKGRSASRVPLAREPTIHSSVASVPTVICPVDSSSSVTLSKQESRFPDGDPELGLKYWALNCWLAVHRADGN